MARTPLSVGKWLRLVWLSAWAASLVVVIVTTARVMLASGRVTPSTVTLVLGASAVLFVVVESMGVEARRPPPIVLPSTTRLRGRRRPHPEQRSV